LRVPSAIAGALAILAIFTLARQLYSSREGLLAAGLLACSYSPIYYSQEARAYSLLLLFSILSAHFWFRLREQLESDDRCAGSTAAAYVACAAATQYLHHFGLLLVAIQLGALLALFALRPRALVRAIGVSAAVVITYLPWVGYLIEDFGEGYDHIAQPTPYSIVKYWNFLFFDTSGYLAWFVAVLLGIAACRWIAQCRAGGFADLAAWLRSPTALLIVWLVVPVALTYLRSVTSVSIFNNRNLIISFAPAIVLLARAMTSVLGSARLQALTAAAIAAVLIYGPFVKGGYYRFPRKEQFREAAAAVAARGDQLSDVRVIAYAWDAPSFDYYLERTGAMSRVALIAGSEADIPEAGAFLEAEDPEHLWYLAGHLRPERAFVQFLDRKLVLVEHVPLHGAFARLYRRRE
jgi:uncharacterized membrane protein